MKLEKAMEILVDLQRHSSTAFSLPELDAINLGFEALKDKQRGRLSFPKVPIRLLPGETKD